MRVYGSKLGLILLFAGAVALAQQPPAPQQELRSPPAPLSAATQRPAPGTSQCPPRGRARTP